MNVLVLNGSPRAKKSNTMKLTEAFITGMKIKNNNLNITTIDIKKFKVEHCLGCFACWEKTSGKCVIKDDMGILLEKYIEADLVIWSLPLYYFGMPSKIKAFMDRMLPLNLPYIENRSDGSGHHPSRYDFSNKKYILISTCGFHSLDNNYEALVRQFKILYGEELETILCTEGELFKVPELKSRTDEYLDYVRCAGEEYILDSKISTETKSKLLEQLYPTEIFLEMANANWKLKEIESSSSSETVATESKAFLQMKLMTTVYNSEKLKKELEIFEFNFTDIKETYQLKLYKDRCELLSENFKKYSLRIETSFELWMQISKGEIDGAQALLENKYRVLGDFSLMKDFNSYFRSGDKKATGKNLIKKKKTNMIFNFIPWIPFWIVNGTFGAIGGILANSLIILSSERYKLTIYDKMNMLTVSLLSVFILSEINIVLDTSSLAYFALSLTWGVSCLRKIPLTAYYSINAYDSDLINNPIFIRTNRVLTLTWSIVFLFIGTAGYLGKSHGVHFVYNLILNIVVLALMGRFTKWFEEWYPAKLARA